jgi:hypothetical protein
VTSLLVLAMAAALSPAPQSKSFPDGESLHYTVDWPSGLSLGEAQFVAKKVGEVWNFQMTLDASVPWFVVKDQFSSQASAGLCSEVFEKRIEQGKKKAAEVTSFDLKTQKAARRTLPDGGTTEHATGACGHDALTFLYHVRRELAAGRVAAPATVMFGAPYQVKLAYGGVEKIQGHDTDRLTGTASGPAAEQSFEVWFARDVARTMVRARVPLAIGAFSLELSR